MNIGKYQLHLSVKRYYCTNINIKHRAFFDQLKIQLKISSLDDWYKVTDVDLGIAKGARFVCKYYSGILYKGTS